MKPADLRGRRVALLGLGIDVEAAIPAIVEAEPGELFVLEEWTAAARDDLGPRFTAFTNLPEIDVAVRSPGFPLHRADVQERVRRGLETVTPLGLWLSERGGARPTIAITGTKGKSTTSLLTATALAQLEIVAHVLGNIGVPPWTVAPDTTDTVVLEISSFQAADLPCAAPYSALTSIGDDHADWHGSTLQYLADKARVFLAPTCGAERWCGVLDDVDLPEPFTAVEFQKISAPAGTVRVRNAKLAAATALTVAGRFDEAALDNLTAVLLDRYPELPGRFHRIANVDDVEYVDDTLASNPLGVVASLGEVQTQPLTLVLGGATRGAAFDDVYRALAERNQPTVVLTLDDAHALRDAVAATGATVETVHDIEQAVARAHACTRAGGVVLFSPGMPTPDGQGRWHARSSRFCAAVDALR